MVDFIEWNNDFFLNNKEIDNHHQRLFEIINQLYSAVLESIHESKLEQIIEELFQYSFYHFEYEEDLFARYNYKYTYEHVKQHEMFTDKVKDFNIKLVMEDKKLYLEILNFIKDWIQKHIPFIDKKFVEFMKAGQIG
ncbi:MAG: hemerythrin family protein [Bacteroidales bacterium]|nr:hemerythrin family protein [Bacteroidales bacterium]